jgi:hypothetical protein
LTQEGCKNCGASCKTCVVSDNETPPTDVKCSECNDTYYLNGASCTTCGTYCAKCSTAECSNCIATAYLTGTKSCALCSSVVSNCAQCDGTADVTQSFPIIYERNARLAMQASSSSLTRIRITARAAQPTARPATPKVNSAHFVLLTTFSTYVNHAKDILLELRVRLCRPG